MFERLRLFMVPLINTLAFVLIYKKIKSFLSSFRLGEQGLYPELSPTKFGAVS